MNEMFRGVFKEGKRIYTAGEKSVYGERIRYKDGKGYREWVLSHSKLAAAMANGLKNFPFSERNKILYLGASTGTTVSHIGDIIGNGIIYAIEFSERMFRSLNDLASQRNNIAAILADARKPEGYPWIEECDIVYCDIAQPDQTAVAIRNADIFLKRQGHLFVVIKSQSIDVTKAPKQIYESERKKIETAGYGILELIDLEPHEEKHCMIVAKKQ